MSRFVLNNYSTNIASIIVSWFLVLQKTAAPVGGGSYNDKTGCGAIDAGAAMDYVKNPNVKHDN
jgi:hypothetical protein